MAPSGTAAVSQERRRAAKRRPASPKAKRERLIGSGVGVGGAGGDTVNVSLNEFRLPVPCVTVAIWSDTVTLLAENGGANT